MPVFELYIPNMVCPACVAPVNALKECKQINNATADFVGHIVTVEADTASDAFINEMKTAVDDVGFACEGLLETTPSLIEDEEIIESKRATHELNKRIRTKKIIRRHWVKGFVGVVTGIAILALSVSGVGIPFLGMALLGGISTLLTLYFGKETYQQAASSLVNAKSLSMDSLFSVSTLLALAVSCAHFFVPGLPMLFDAALLILGFKNVGKAIEESVKQQITKKSFRSYAPSSIEAEISPLLRREIPVKNIRPGNIIYVKKGQTVPVDGVCLSENKTIYNTIVTGRTVPQYVTTNHVIYAGCVVPDNVEYIKIRVTDHERNSYLALLDKRIKAAEQDKSVIELAAERSLKYFIPIVFGIAILSAIFVSAFLTPVAAIQCAISVLVSACPCTLGLVTPLAIKTGIAKAADHGVSFKNGNSIQAASDIDTIVFDLNGTLTTGVLKVTKSKLPSDVFQHLAYMESESSHPFGQAIYKLSTEQKYVPRDFKECKIDRSHHSGVSADIDGDNFVVGNSELMDVHEIKTHEYDEELKKENAEHVIYVAKNKKVIGYILLEDPLRDDAIATITELRKMNKKIHLCTGADFLTTKKYADKLNIPVENIRSKCVGESKDDSANTKSKYIRELIAQGRRVAMIGDSGNDASAVATSHFGVAVASASAHRGTQENAGAVINQNSLWAVVNAFSIAKQTVSNIRQNLWISIGYNLTTMIAFSGLLVAVGFAVNPALGAALMVLQTAFILMNVERFKRQSVPSISTLPSPSPQPSIARWQSTDGLLNEKGFKKEVGLVQRYAPSSPALLPSPTALREKRVSDAILSVTQEKRVLSPHI